jgi:ketosteroid isomerase-like protein
MSAGLAPDEVVRRFFDCYSEGRPQDFDQVVAPDYVYCGHTPPGRGPDGARDDYENAIKLAGGPVRYTIDSRVTDDDVVSAAWTGVLPNGAEMKGLSVYRVAGGLISSTRHALIGKLPL